MTPTLTPESRTELLDQLELAQFDVIVIGGGIAAPGLRGRPPRGVCE